MYVRHRASASYSVLCREPYDPMTHIRAKTKPDLFNKELKRALMQIDWLITKVRTCLLKSCRCFGLNVSRGAISKNA